MINCDQEMILNLYASNHSTSEIVRKIGCPQSRVEYVLSSARKRGDHRAWKRRTLGSAFDQLKAAETTIVNGIRLPRLKCLEGV